MQKEVEAPIRRNKGMRFFILICFLKSVTIMHLGRGSELRHTFLAFLV